MLLVHLPRLWMLSALRSVRRCVTDPGVEPRQCDRGRGRRIENLSMTTRFCSLELLAQAEEGIDADAGRQGCEVAVLATEVALVSPGAQSAAERPVAEVTRRQAGVGAKAWQGLPHCVVAWVSNGDCERLTQVDAVKEMGWAAWAAVLLFLKAAARLT